MDVLNGHPKWAQDGQRGKNTYGLGSIVVNIALKEIDRKRSMLRGHVLCHRHDFQIVFYRLLQTTCW